MFCPFLLGHPVYVLITIHSSIIHKQRRTKHPLIKKNFHEVKFLFSFYFHNFSPSTIGQCDSCRGQSGKGLRFGTHIKINIVSNYINYS